MEPSRTLTMDVESVGRDERRPSRAYVYAASFFPAKFGDLLTSSLCTCRGEGEVKREEQLERRLDREMAQQCKAIHLKGRNGRGSFAVVKPPKLMPIAAAGQSSREPQTCGALYEFTS